MGPSTFRADQSGHVCSGHCCRHFPSAKPFDRTFGHQRGRHPRREQPVGVYYRDHPFAGHRRRTRLTVQAYPVALILHAPPPGSGKLIKLQFKITLKLIDMAKEIKPVDSSGADKTLVALFLKMSPEERLQANDNAVRTILELRNAYQQQKREKSRPERDT